jgi:nicotinate-nucleotide--dimethylbenzimidazole phosphoribosyltransferase
MHGIRVLLVQLDPQAGALVFSGVDQARIGLHDLPSFLRHRDVLEDAMLLDLDILRLQVYAPMRSGGAATDCRWIRGEDVPCGSSGRLDKHRLDVALSAGRHAAERAKLAGVRHLIGVAPSVRSAIGRHAACEMPCLGRNRPGGNAGSDPYDALGCRGLPEVAALVGVAIAAAQMGIPLCLPDPAGGVATDLAVRLNPGVRAWLDAIPAAMPASPRQPDRSLTLSAI